MIPQIIPVAMGIGCLALGFLFLAVPRKVIEFQIAFYRKINWIMEPVSWEREIRNTRIMGLMALLAGLLGLGFAVISCMRA